MTRPDDEQEQPGVGWQDSFRGLAGALGDLAKAEAAVLKEDLAQWGKRFGVAVALFLVAFMTIFWLVALLLYAAVRGVEQVFDFGPAVAGLIVAGCVFGLILVLGLIGFFLLRSVSGPMAAAKRRYQDHRTWWQQQVLGEVDVVHPKERR